MNGATLHWDPSTDESVRGYNVEREPISDEDIYYRIRHTNFRASNHMYFPSPGTEDDSQIGYRVRARSDDGYSDWSDWIRPDPLPPLRPDSPVPQPSILRIDASSSTIRLVWESNGPLEDTVHRILRREVGVEEEYRSGTYRDWIVESEFNWGYAYGPDDLGLEDDVDVLPDTEYEYAVQLKRGDEVGPKSEPVSIRTLPVPNNLDRRPLPVAHIDATPTNEGVKLTWDLPMDPTREGIIVTERFIRGVSTASHENGNLGERSVMATGLNTRWRIAWRQSVTDSTLDRSPVVIVGWPPTLLGSDTTELLVLDEFYDQGPNRYCYEVETFNSFGVQEVGFQRTCIDPPDMVHCGATFGGVSRGDGGQPQIRFRACEESLLRIVRSELNVDGLRAEDLQPTCEWKIVDESSQTSLSQLETFAGTMYCQFVDNGVKAGTWYLYELTQTFADGRTQTSTHEFLVPPP